LLRVCHECRCRSGADDQDELAVSFAHRVGAPRKNAARAAALSRGDSFVLCSVRCEDQSRQSVRVLDGALGADESAPTRSMRVQFCLRCTGLRI
jgi:hypothetical protein